MNGLKEKCKLGIICSNTPAAPEVQVPQAEAILKCFLSITSSAPRIPKKRNTTLPSKTAINYPVLLHFLKYLGLSSRLRKQTTDKEKLFPKQLNHS